MDTGPEPHTVEDDLPPLEDIDYGYVEEEDAEQQEGGMPASVKAALLAADLRLASFNAPPFAAATYPLDADVLTVLKTPDLLVDLGNVARPALAYIAQERVLLELLQLITVIPPLDSVTNLRPEPTKMPMYAAHIFQLRIQPVTEMLCTSETLLTQLFSILDCKYGELEPEDLVYFRSVAEVCLGDAMHHVLPFLMTHAHVIDRLFAHIGSEVILDLLEMIPFTTDQQYQYNLKDPTKAEAAEVAKLLWLSDLGFLDRLTAALVPEHACVEGMQENAANIIVDITQQTRFGGCPTWEFLVQPWLNDVTLKQLFAGINSDSPNTTYYCTYVIITLLLREGGFLEPEPDPDEQMVLDQVGVEGLAELRKIQAHRAEVQATTQRVLTLVKEQRPEVKFELEPEQTSGGPVVEHCVQNIRLIVEQLRVPGLESKTGSEEKLEAFGLPRHNLVELLLTLLRCDREDVNEQIAASGLFALGLDLFVAYPDYNILHGLVESMIRGVIDSKSTVLKDAVFVQAQFIDKALAAFEDNRQYVKASVRHGRRGYMGHLIRICNTVEVLGEHDEFIRNVKNNHPAWKTFVATELATENSHAQTVLGGGYGYMTGHYLGEDDVEPEQQQQENLDLVDLEQQQQQEDSGPPLSLADITAEQTEPRVSGGNTVLNSINPNLANAPVSQTDLRTDTGPVDSSIPPPSSS
jgi:hypothetical protein